MTGSRINLVADVGIVGVIMPNANDQQLDGLQSHRQRSNHGSVTTEHASRPLALVAAIVQFRQQSSSAIQLR